MTQSWTWKVGRTLLLAAIAMFYTTSHTPKAQACWRCVPDGPYWYCVSDELGSAYDCEIEVDGSCTEIGSGCIVD
jgi:hypothetical protein